ncbi:probable ubiquitin-conjugating enzyme E2 23 [Hordeum vulgare subsp. vulgare]|uniref:probable ubiquitin-conjugating enzyme E2 23 n=1 Tax=Hordeum vulgare subsp. vulgare TaxID=112509 RepID=UPI001D1A3806|nr:probable ubiquitin-conjugating enzyme E2 23 [Hordeum vulgare subsp. vulgare]
MDVVAEPWKIYQLDLVSFGHESDGVGNRGLVTPATGVPSLPVGTVTILCVDGSVVTRKACDLNVLDRSCFYPGEVVASASDPGALCLDDYVVSGPWLGRVIEVSTDVYVLFDDGAMCKVANAESTMLRSVAKADAHYRPEMNIPFYPGQRVTGDPCAVFKASRWLNGHWRPDRIVGTVTKLEMSGVLVYWIASAHGGTGQQHVQEFAPPAYQNPGSLTFFCSASDCTWAVADMCFLRKNSDSLHAAGETNNKGAGDGNHQGDQPVACSDDEYDTTEEDERESPTVLTKQQQETRFYRKQLRKEYFHGQRRTRCLDVGRHVELDQLPMSVASTRSTVDVLWQDGTRQLGAPSTSVVPFRIVNEQEFLPGQYVVDNAFPAPNVHVDAATGVAGDDDGSGASTSVKAAADGGTELTRRVGFVRSLNCKDQMVHVSWFKAASRPGQAREIDCNDTVSAYNLEREPDHYAYYGDVVVRLVPSGPTDSPIAPPSQGNSKKKAAVVATTDLSWVGRVVDLPDGLVQVKWGDGTTSTVCIFQVFPYEICVVSKQNYEELEAEMGDWVEDDGIDPPQEPATDNTENHPQNLTHDGNVNGNEDHADGDGPAAITTGRLGSAGRFVIGWASNVLARGNSYLADWSSWPLSSSKLYAAAENVATPETVPGGGGGPSNEAAMEVTDVVVASGDSVSEGKETADANVNEEPLCAPRFDIVRDSPPDHHYLDTAAQDAYCERRWVKIVQREWKILENNLPDTIYVRAFEDRIDLLRAVMVGARETPYHDGLFFFDLQLPPSYPAAPPYVYYHSFGFRLNPNLYASGTVCLSLLNTFGGEGTEIWSPVTSTLLQVLVSIQGLVLNNQPYYNEAGYEALVGMPEGFRNALPYNENAYVLTLRTMLHLLRRPPLGFEEFVKDHFRHRGRLILRACEAYLQGCEIGTLCSEACATKRSSERSCSAGLRLTLANLVPRLVTTFAEIGTEECV